MYNFKSCFWEGRNTKLSFACPLNRPYVSPNLFHVSLSHKIFVYPSLFFITVPSLSLLCLLFFLLFSFASSWPVFVLLYFLYSFVRPSIHLSFSYTFVHLSTSLLTMPPLHLIRFPFHQLSIDLNILDYCAYNFLKFIMKFSILIKHSQLSVMHFWQF